LGCLAWALSRRTLGCRRAAQVDPVADRNASHVQSLGGKRNDQAPFAPL
jgi:hypothetical protein